jgi:putative NIF3 family GTP cyclohydrolase 1 type 2
MNPLRFLSLLLFVAIVSAQTPPSAEVKQLTARQVIDRITKETGATPPANTVDTIKEGDPDTPVTGIATTFLATLDVLQRAAASGKNLIIAHEPTFYNHLDRTAQFESDAVYQAKRDFIRKHGLVVWRFHDLWHMRKPDGVLAGMEQALGWDQNANSQEPHLITLGPTTLWELAADIRNRLRIRTLRFVGDPQTKLTKVALLPGAAGSQRQIALLQRDDVEVLVIGETPEWETVEYVRDATTLGKHKSLIIMGHAVSEEAGMKECERWLKTFLSGIPIEFIPAGEPFSTPK